MNKKSDDTESRETNKGAPRKIVSKRFIKLHQDTRRYNDGVSASDRKFVEERQQRERNYKILESIQESGKNHSAVIPSNNKKVISSRPDLLIDDETQKILDAAMALRKEFARAQPSTEVSAEGSFTSGMPKPKWPGRRRGPKLTGIEEELSPSDFLRIHYAADIAAGNYLASDLKRDDPRLYSALVYEANQDGKSLADYLPLKQDRYEERRRHMATILGTDADQAAEFFGTARRSMGPRRER